MLYIQLLYKATTSGSNSLLRSCVCPDLVFWVIVHNQLLNKAMTFRFNLLLMSVLTCVGPDLIFWVIVHIQLKSCMACRVNQSQYSIFTPKQEVKLINYKAISDMPTRATCRVHV